MGSEKTRYYCLLLAAVFVMFCLTPIGCSCSKKKKDSPPGVGALTVSEGPQNGTTGGPVTAGDTDVVMLQFTVATGDAFTQVVSVKIKDIGDGIVTATGVVDVRLFHDVNSNAQLEVGTDIELAGPGPQTFAADRTVTFSVNQMLNPFTTQEWIVVYDFGADADGTYICTLEDVARDISTTVGGHPNIPQVPGGGTGSITGQPATAQENTLTVAEGPNNPPDSSVPGGSTDVVMLQFSLEAGPNTIVTLTSVTFNATGTGHEVNDIAAGGVKLWDDSDNDGSPDVQIDVAKVYTADNGTVSWTDAAGLVDVAASGTSYLILTYDFVAGVDGTFRVEITDVTTDVTAEAGGEAITPQGTSPVSGPTITVDSTPPEVIRAMFDGPDPDNPAVGDTIKVYFNEPLASGTTPTVNSFVLPNTTGPDSFGTGASAALSTTSDSTVVITLGTTPTLTIPGTFAPAAPLAGPSGIDVDPGITAAEICDLAGNAPIQQSPNPGVDIKGKFIPDGNPVTDLEMNVLAPYGPEVAGDGNGFVWIQYFVAAPDAMTTVTLTVEYNDGSGFQAATEDTTIFADNSDFNPSITGDLRLFVWDAVTDFPDAGSTGDNDPVGLRFTFDPGTPLDATDDVIDEISFNLDNKPQAVGTRPFVIPARKWAFLSATDSWVPGGVSVIGGDDYTWTLDSTPAGSTLLDSDIVLSTQDMLAYFEPDVAGDYVLSLQVTGNLVDSDIVTTTVHALGPDSYFGSCTCPQLNVGGTDWDIMPGSIALDATPGSEAIFWNSSWPLGAAGNTILRCTSGKIDVSTLPGTVPTDGSDMVWFYSYSAQYGIGADLPYDFAQSIHMDTYYNNGRFSMACTNLIIWTDGNTYYQGNVYLDSVTFGTSPDFYVEEAQADLNTVNDLGVANSYGRSGRVCQVERAAQPVDYWIVNAMESGTGALISSWVVETQGDATTPYTPTFTPIAIPDSMQGYDVDVQLNTHGANATTLWVSGISGTGGNIYWADLSAGVGNPGALTAITDYPGAAPCDMVIDDTNGYLFVSDVGDIGTWLNGSIYAISLDTRAVVATLNLPGDFTLEELDINLDTIGNPVMLFGTNSAAERIHVVWVDYSGGTPVMTCLPCIDCGTDPWDVVYAESVAGVSDVLFFAERSMNTITSASGSTTPWVIDHAASNINSAVDEQNADWAVDPVSGDLCMVFQRDAGGGIFFTRSADGGLTWSAPAQVDDGGAANLSDPDIAVDKWGSIIVVWADDDLGNYDVWMRRSDDGGTTWDTAAVKVNTDAANDQGNPCVTVDFLGNILVAFESGDGTGNIAIEMVKGVGHQKWTYFGPDDSNLAVVAGPPVPPATLVCSDPDIAMSPRDPYMPDVWVVWSDTRGPTSLILANYTNTAYGNTTPFSGMVLDFQTNDFVVNDSTAGDAIHPRCAYDAVTETLVVVWEQDLGNGAGIYIDEGAMTGFGTDEVVEEPVDASSGTRNNPYLSILPFVPFATNESVRVVAYESDLKSVTNKDVFWEIRRESSPWWDGEGARLNAVITGSQTRPLIHIYQGENSIVTWQDGRLPANGIDFYSKRQ